MVQVEEHPSPLTIFPSSHAYGSIKIPSPQVGLQLVKLDW